LLLINAAFSFIVLAASMS